MVVVDGGLVVVVVGGTDVAVVGTADVVGAAVPVVEPTTVVVGGPVVVALPSGSVDCGLVDMLGDVGEGVVEIGSAESGGAGNATAVTAGATGTRD